MYCSAKGPSEYVIFRSTESKCCDFALSFYQASELIVFYRMEIFLGNNSPLNCLSFAQPSRTQLGLAVA